MSNHRRSNENPEKEQGTSDVDPEEERDENRDRRSKSEVIRFPSRISVQPSPSVGPIRPTPQRSERSVRWRQLDVKEDDETSQSSVERDEQLVTSEERIHQLEKDCIQLQQKLTAEVARAVRKWRSRNIGTSLESHNDTLEEIVRRLDSTQGRGQDDGGRSIIQALRQDNLNLAAELERLKRLNASEHAVQKLQEIQSEIRSLQDRVHKLQEEASEKKATHARELQRRQAELRRLLHQCEGSAEAVRRARARAESRRQDPEHGRTDPDPEVPVVDLQLKVDRARLRLQRTQRELDEKRRHPKKLPHSADSLEELCAVWAEQVRLLERLQRRDAERALLRDRVLMFRRNMEILRKENDALEAQLQGVHEQVSRFAENPMTPTALVERNVNLLLHMEKIERTLAEKAVELDKQEKELQLEQSKVREVLIAVEELRKENRHLNRRIQQAERKREEVRPSELRADRPPLGSQNLSMFLLPVSDKEREGEGNGDLEDQPEYGHKHSEDEQRASSESPPSEEASVAEDSPRESIRDSGEGGAGNSPEPTPEV